ncbi:MAG: phosphoribosylformylglycinamidine cyclo-ligase [Planctomycetaceae bacterium]
MSSSASATYKSAGVDLDLYDDAMRRLPPLMQRTFTPRVLPIADAFAGLFRLNDSSRPFQQKYDDPVLVSGTDGVGTKLKVAQLAQKYDTVGIDLVAMSVNDCLCLGAEPLLFLDYLALGKDNPNLIAKLVEGVSEGCLQAKAALLGGETAIMPDLYAGDDFDMAGFCVGVVERNQIIDGKGIHSGDVLIGLASSGFHSNGYSLIRRAVFGMAGLTIDHLVPDLNRTVGDVLLEPTRIYAQTVAQLLPQFPARTAISGLAHITGGGLKDNIERLLPDGCRVNIDRRSWPTPPEFAWVQRLGNVDHEEMFHVFNMGIGFVVIVRPQFADAIRNSLDQSGIRAWLIGEVRSGERGVEYYG